MERTIDRNVLGNLGCMDQCSITCAQDELRVKLVGAAVSGLGTVIDQFASGDD